MIHATPDAGQARLAHSCYPGGGIRVGWPPVSVREAAMIELSCPRCDLAITPKASWLAIEHCPRCLARSRVAVPLLAAAAPTDAPGATDTAPQTSDALDRRGRRR